MKLYNTLSRKVEEIKPINQPTITVYTCGPTVYDYPHVGNWFTFVRYDILVRTLELTGLRPKWVMNITDVGHLVSDADEGEDKLEKGARREGKNAWNIAKFYSDYFVDALGRLNFRMPDMLPKATEHIQEQIELVKKLEEKGFTYITDDGVYYDTSKFPHYADFAQLDLDEQQAGKRVDHNPQKRNTSDFALWKFSPTGQKRDMEWWAPWRPEGEADNEKHPLGWRNGMPEEGDPVTGSWGFPGWHIECSAMSMKYLGETIDVHAGGIDHLPVHHTNEIAQSEAVTGKPFARSWMHTNHITVEGEKISKSLGNGITLEDIEKRGISLMALRLHILESHYRSQSKFSWESLEAAQYRLDSWRATAALVHQPVGLDTDGEQLPFLEAARDIRQLLQNDLDTPHVLSSLSGVFNQIAAEGVDYSSIGAFEVFLETIDNMLGLHLGGPDISDTQKMLIQQRQKTREAGDWQKSDEIRAELTKQGIGLRDTDNGAIWYRL